ncbi:GIY-YIG nuclease family protein [Vibrio vulnificus]|nr:GIY-YIG nuclease family protein [Vibrio vulnificus]HAS6309365.1 hypothetical protein [Vibrio vulnificus]HDY7581062.1 GIY-YIG nuclease family protein [Vibrio vulnificus]
MKDIRDQDFYKKASPNKQVELLTFYRKTTELQQKGMLSKHNIDGVGFRPALKTLCYTDFDLKYCIDNWNSNVAGITVCGTHTCNPTISAKYEFIYFLICEDELIYIGRTVNLFQRIDAHANDKKFDVFKWLLVEKAYVDFLEKYFIDQYRPIENRFIAKPVKPENISNDSWIILGGEI